MQRDYKKFPRYICEPAECYSGCNDEMCHYTHTTTWRVPGVEQPFTSEQAVLDYIEAEDTDFRQTLNSL